MARVRVFLLILVSLLLVACSDKPSATRESRQPISEKELEELFGPGNEQVGLLAAKYKLPENQVRDIIKGYLRKHDFLYHLLVTTEATTTESSAATTQPNTQVADTLRELQRTSGISEAVLAQIIYDYRVWQACSEAATADK